MGRRSWRWHIEKNDDFVVIKKRYNRLSGEWEEEERYEGLEKAKEVVLRCPKCGAMATSYEVRELYPNIFYIYLQHWSPKKGGEGRKHSWYLAKLNPIWKEFLHRVMLDSIGDVFLITPDLKKAVDKVLRKRKGYSPEEKQAVYDLIEKIMSAEAIILR